MPPQRTPTIPAPPDLGPASAQAGAALTAEGTSAQRRIAALCGLGAALLGAAGLVGWVIGSPFLIRVTLGYKAIAPTVAISLVILGSLLPRLASPARLTKRSRYLLALPIGLITVVGLLEVVGLLAGADLNLEDALTRSLARSSSITFETMSPVAGALLFLLGSAMLALLSPNRPRLGDAAGVLSLLAATIALVFGLGYAYGVPLLYGEGPVIPIAVTATLGSFLLSIGAVAAAGHRRWPLRALAGGSARAQLLRAFVPLTVFVVLAVAVAHHRLHALEDVNHVLFASVVALIFASLAGLMASRVAQTIGGSIEQTEHALRESREDLNRAQAVAHTGSWRLDVRRNELVWSEENSRIFGLPLGTPLTYESFLATVHPEDREFVDAQWQAALRGAPYDIEHRIVVGDTIKWVRERAGLEFDARGVLRGGFGATQDITARKLADQERERLYAEVAQQRGLLETILENTDAHLAFLDRDFNFIWVNSAYARACRRSREEFVGHNHFEFYPHAENEAIFQRVRDTGEPVRYVEKPFEHPDTPERGLTYWDWTLTPLKNAGGEVENLIFSLSDVTEKVKTRERLLEAERLRAHMAETVAREINHRMKNNLMLVSGVLELQLRTHPPHTDTALALRQAKARIAALSTVHEQIYEHVSGRVELGDVLRRIAEMAVSALASGEVDLSVSSDLVYAASRTASTLAVVSNELVTNALKHGSPDSDGRQRVQVTLLHRDRKLHLRVWSSGTPLPPDFDPVKQPGLGLQLCRELVAGELGGSFDLSSHDGGTLSEAVVDDVYLD